MAWYTTHLLRYRGRLVSVGTRYGRYNGASVVHGKPLDLSYDSVSKDKQRLVKLFRRSRSVQQEIQAFHNWKES